MKIFTSPIFYCPFCSLLKAGWLFKSQRDTHVFREHPKQEIPETFDDWPQVIPQRNQ